MPNIVKDGLHTGSDTEVFDIKIAEYFFDLNIVFISQSY